MHFLPSPLHRILSACKDSTTLFFSSSRIILGRAALAICGDDSCSEKTFHSLRYYGLKLAGLICNKFYCTFCSSAITSLSDTDLFQVLQPSRFLKEIPDHLREIQVHLLPNNCVVKFACTADQNKKKI